MIQLVSIWVKNLHLSGPGRVESGIKLTHLVGNFLLLVFFAIHICHCYNQRNNSGLDQNNKNMDMIQ